MSEIKTIGIVGGGQLGRMLAEAALPMGYDVTVVENDLNCPAAQIDERVRVIKGSIKDMGAIGQLAEETDVVTWEIEHIPSGFLGQLALRGHNVQPSPRSLNTIQDKLKQKQFFSRRGIDVPVAPFMAIETEADIVTAQKELGEALIKTRRGGYDGRGTLVLDGNSPMEVLEWATTDDGRHVPVYAEKKLPFRREIAILAARSRRGDVAVYPLVETVHRDNICHITIAPAPGSGYLQAQSEWLAQRVMKHIDGAGVVAIEAFDVAGKLYMNEIAPRVHNSGHWTIEGAETSQFEQHIRAITGMPLGSTEMRDDVASAVMINILGEGKSDGRILTDADVAEARALVPGLGVHLYGKTARKARKLGHMTVTAGPDVPIDTLRAVAELARSTISV